MIKIEITKDAIDYLAENSYLEREDIEDLLATAVSMCYISNSTDEEWFNAKTVKPADNNPVLGFVDEGIGQYIELVVYDDRDKAWVFADYPLSEATVTHWMPLPKAPSPEK